jgi:uncharacterized protein (DUF1800 family)
MKLHKKLITLHAPFHPLFVALLVCLGAQFLAPFCAFASQAPAIKVTAVSGQGYNPATALLNRNTTFTAIVSNSSDTAVTWSLQGAGTLTSAGFYSAPASMPANPSVTVTATLVSAPSVSASYTMTLLNPPPVVSAVSPAVVLPGTTNTIKIGGLGFTTASTIVVDGSPVPTTYLSTYNVVAQVPVAKGKASISVAVANPTPGGGTSAPMAIPLTAPTITLTAVSGQGYNPTTALLNRNTTFTPIITNSTNTSVTWSVQGAGTITSAGLYSAPAAMPANPSVTVTATLVSEPSVSASYTLTLLYPAPVVTGVSPTVLVPGTTNTVKVGGSGFTAGSSILINGSPVATTYLSQYNVSAQVPVSASQKTALSVSVSNPAPGGGLSTVLSIPLNPATIKVTAVSGQGYDPTTALLSRNTTFTAIVSNSTNTAVTWSLQGPGTISAAGVYTAPDTLPANPAVTVTATLVSEPSVSASYALTVVNPPPIVTAILPSTVTLTSNTITLNGSAFMPSSVVLVNGSPVPTTYVSAYNLKAQVTGTESENTSVAITVQNPAPGGGTSAPLNLLVQVPGVLSVSPSPVPVGTSTITVKGVNFGPSSVVYLDGQPAATTYVSPTQVTAVAHIAPWRNDSLSVGITTTASSSNPAISVPITNTSPISYDEAARFSAQAAFGPRPDVVSQIQQSGLSAFLNQQFAQPVSVYPPLTGDQIDAQSQANFTINALTGTNLLRQRVAFALEEFITASIVNDKITKSGVPWQLMMEKDAFGNFRNLIQDVTLNTTMGYWLNLGNNWAPSSSAVHPNQNYARELLQLFTIGPVMLNMDGSTVLDSSGNPVPSIDTTTVLNLSRALTGWGIPPADGTQYSDAATDYALPMVANDSRHDHGSKTLFGSVTLPAGQTITQDLQSALDAVFNHPNVPPFVSRLLIQHLVKSDPSPAYISRIANVFANDGTGVRGNLQAVVRAILLDPEARSGDSGVTTATDGHLQEPVLYFLSVMSGLQTAPNGTHFVPTEAALAEYIWEPPTVFSFYTPNFMIPGTTINAPEFQIFDGNMQIQRSQVLYNIINGTQLGFSSNYQNSDWFFTYFTTVPSIVDAVNHMYYHGTMPAETQSAIQSYCQSLPTLQQQQTTALYLALNSDSFQISH